MFQLKREGIPPACQSPAEANGRTRPQVLSANGGKILKL
jgi:hypothetical protein